MTMVDGRPRTKGSLEPVHIRTGAGKCRVSLKDNPLSVAWKNRMIAVIRRDIVCLKYVGPVIVDATFVFEREAAAHAEARWPTARQYGDEDKLRRNLLDALSQSGLLADDSQVIGGETWKRFATAGEEAGVTFVVCEVAGNEAGF